jgi:hypothetical protein
MRSGDGGNRVIFAIDFHSTFRDVFYTVAEDPARRPGGLLDAWIGAMQARFPGRMSDEPFAATTSVFKNWAFCTYGAAAITYEVGDETSDALLADIARTAAQTLMTQLETSLPPDARAERRCAVAQ